MIESPFAATSEIIAEVSNAFDDVRIIARDRKSLSAADKAHLETAADELETSQKTCVALYMQLLEANQKLIAVNDQLIAARRDNLSLRKGAALPMFPSLRLTISGHLVPSSMFRGAAK